MDWEDRVQARPVESVWQGSTEATVFEASLGHSPRLSPRTLWQASWAFVCVCVVRLAAGNG